jgi:hypothetical protein
VVYKGEVLLTGVTTKNNLMVIIKGKKTLSTAYGKSGQTETYNQPNGMVEVTSDSATTIVNDFTKYPLLAGDVTGTSGAQYGSIDGYDFTYVKTEANKRSEGDNMLADLNGNCKLESLDLYWLMASMNSKQEQLY